MRKIDPLYCYMTWHRQAFKSMGALQTPLSLIFPNHLVDFSNRFDEDRDDCIPVYCPYLGYLRFFGLY